jgi:hypothetical protein
VTKKSQKSHTKVTHLFVYDVIIFVFADGMSSFALIITRKE